MIHALIYHGFPIGFTIGKFSRNFFHGIINQIDLSFPNDRNLVIDGTWLDWDFQNACDAIIAVYNPNKIWIGSLTDPWSMQDWAVEKFQDREIYIFGNASGPYAFNFWSIFCQEHFPVYDLDNVFLNDQPQVFLCYQNKPKLHRQMLVHKFISNNLENQGVLTLSDSPDGYIYPTLKKRILLPDDYLSKITFNDGGYNIGNLEIWKNCFINIISETEMDDSSEIFVSEKTWKPILGYRPFILNGDMRIYSYLRKHGFDVFEDLWPVKEMERLDLEKRIDIIVDIVKELATQPKNELKKQWLGLLPRLQYNHDRMIEFAKEQNYRANHLFEE